MDKRSQKLNSFFNNMLKASETKNFEDLDEGASGDSDIEEFTTQFTYLKQSTLRKGSFRARQVRTQGNNSPEVLKRDYGLPDDIQSEDSNA
jgi:hypothetical protein